MVGGGKFSRSVFTRHPRVGLNGAVCRLQALLIQKKLGPSTERYTWSKPVAPVVVGAPMKVCKVQVNSSAQ